MLFNSLAYMIFLPVVFLLYWKTPFKFRTPLLLIASYVFYMYWKWEYGLLILGLTALNYFLGFWVERATVKKKLVFGIGIALNVIILGFFKYAYFVHDVVSDAAKAVGQPALPNFTVEIILPLGISFFVFEFIHYLFEIYRGAKPVKSFMEFALFPSFFPTQIAGPIKRYADFIPQLHKEQKLTQKDFDEGVELILFGLFKKVVMADNFALVVNRCFAHPDLVTSADLWLALYCFAWQGYFDFSGYTDIARGSAQILGFKVPLNFNLPYLAGSISEIWRRWHISLSTWLRDYLFIPMGGSKGGELLTYRNIMLTMIIGGFWHGASLHYGFWGGTLGLFMVIHRGWQTFYKTKPWLENIIKTKYYHVFAVFLTMHAWCLSLVFMRSPDMNVAWTVMKKVLFLDTAQNTLGWWQPSILATTDTNLLYPLLPFILVATYAMQLLVAKSKEIPGVMPDFKLNLFGRQIPAFKPAYLAALLIVLFIWSPDFSPQFIYFQF